MSIRLAVFDFDSTLMDGETLELLAQDTDLRAKLKSITDRAMAGELDFFESLSYRLNLLKGMKNNKTEKYKISEIIFFRS